MIYTCEMYDPVLYRSLRVCECATEPADTEEERRTSINEIDTCTEMGYDRIEQE